MRFPTSSYISRKTICGLAGAFLIFPSVADGEGPRCWNLFQGEDRSAAERFAAADPYVKDGIVTRWRVFEWMVVVE